MAQKCVHKGCGKTFTDPEEDCVYHPGPPEFHEGQKGWKCCKPRFLTFDEFLSIPPCTTGKHSTVDDSPAPEPKPTLSEAAGPAIKPIATNSNGTTTYTSSHQPPPTRPPQSASSAPPTAPPPPESDSDDPATTIPPNVTCKRRGCGTSSPSSTQCTYHPGQALFHEGTKGWTCCKRRVLEFDEFMKIPGCKTRPTHCFVGKKKTAKQKTGGASDDEWEKVEQVRNDFYQTPDVVHASFFLKKIDKAQAKVEFESDGRTVALDLKTTDGKRFDTRIPLFGTIVPEKSSFKVLGTKLDLALIKSDGLGWPVLRSDDRLTGEIIQTGNAGRA